jgi:23S rRNA-/tRNA-specific pseudouridylate synthase
VLSPALVQVYDKPAGLPVFPPHGDSGGDCVLARVLAQEPWRSELSWPQGFEGGLAHRLDTSTSGAVALARDLDELASLRELFRGKLLRKVYHLRAARTAPWREHACEAEIAHDPRHKGRMVVRRGGSTPHRGRWMEAHSRFRHLGADLYECVITTGVMHQVRLHAAFLGIAILGDRRYGGGPTPADAPAGLTFYLHHVGFTGPGGLRTAPVPRPAWDQGESSMVTGA